MIKMQAFFISLFVFTSQAALAAPLEPLERRIARQVESSRIKNAQLGLVVADTDGQVIYQLNSEKKFIPASLTKILTAAAVLEKLPVGFQLLTELKGDQARVKENRLQGDLYLKGGGDAGFVSESMWFLVNEFQRTGIKEIEGDIVVDDTRFDNVRFDASRDLERVDRAYDAPIGAMTFNWSAVNVFVRPGLKAGEPARVFVDPENEYFTVVNQARTSAAKEAIKIEVRNASIAKPVQAATRKAEDTKGDGLAPREEIVVSGRIPIGSPEFVAYKSITQPDIWAAYNLKEFLRQRGVKVRGVIRSGATPKGADTFATYKSRPVQDLVGGMMKFSNNYIAEILTKNLGAEVKGAPGTMAKGIEVLREYLKDSGLTEAEVYNPSGLSRKNMFRPQDLLQILGKVKHDFRLYPEYLSSLPIAGVDGTLKRRMGGEKKLGQVRAKTGHLSGVAGLGGFTSDQSGRLYSFVFLFNGGVDEAYKSKDLFDNIIQEVLRTN